MGGNSVERKDGGEQAGDWDALAGDVAVSVDARFGHRLLGLPGTWIGAISCPATQAPTPWSEWHYWWQAHYLDAVVDSGLRNLRHGNGAAAAVALSRAGALLRGIMVRNFGRFPNYYYDDMAWLALAAGRLNELSLAAGGKPAALAGCASSKLTAQLQGAHDDVLGGGIYWSRRRDYKNSPANGPAALHFARIGELDRARGLVDWLRSELFDPGLGLYLDGVHPSATGRDVERAVYTYNQGPVLAALLELDHPRYVGQAADLIDAVDLELTVPDANARPLRLEPGGDGSLFTGILCRYLAIAAGDARLPQASRETAARLVRDTACGPVRAQDPELLSAAVQRWMILEAAASLGNEVTETA